MDNVVKFAKPPRLATRSCKTCAYLIKPKVGAGFNRCEAGGGAYTTSMRGPHHPCGPDAAGWEEKEKTTFQLIRLKFRAWLEKRNIG